MDFNYNLAELDKLSDKEKEYALSILKELSETGKSKKYDDLLYADYEEIPVDIETFLHDPMYLGKGLTDEEGRFTVFPYWVNMLKQLFPTNIDTNFSTLILSGSIGIGKSFVADIAILYMLYRVLCLKDPYTHFGLQPIDTITFSFMNITLGAAKGVAWDKAQQLLQSSPWFMARGKLNKAEKPEWQPSKGIELIYGSLPRHILGRCVFCLDGNTVIKTDIGDLPIKELVGKSFRTYSVNDKNDVCLSDECTALQTTVSKEEYEIELEDGSVIRCTPNHRFLLKDGTYKEAKDLTEDDELFDISTSMHDEYIRSIIEKRGQYGIGEDEYFEAHHIVPVCMGGSGSAYKSKHTDIKDANIVFLYPEEHFHAHKLLAEENPTSRQLWSAWAMMAFPKGKTKRYYPITEEEYGEIRRKLSHFSHTHNNFLKDGKPWCYGKRGIFNEETLRRISEAQKRRTHFVSDETKKRMSEAQRKRDWSNCVSPNKGKVVATDGTRSILVNKSDPLPNGFYYGMHTKGKKHDMSGWTEEMSNARSRVSSGKNNPMYGKGYKLSGARNGHATHIYTFMGEDFYCRDDLMVRLKEIYPAISESTIRRIMRGTYQDRIVKKFPLVVENLTWRLKSDEDKKNLQS